MNEFDDIISMKSIHIYKYVYRYCHIILAMGKEVAVYIIYTNFVKSLSLIGRDCRARQKRGIASES